MKTGLEHPGKTSARARKRRAALLEVWLELLQQIEGPKRRRATEYRRRRDNPIRRAPDRNSQLRAFGARHWRVRSAPHARTAQIRPAQFRLDRAAGL